MPTTSALRTGKSRSCGCYTVDRIAVLNRTKRRVDTCECGDHVFTDLTRGFVGLLSVEDRHHFDDESWNAHKSTSGAWSVTGTYAKKLHREVLGLTDPAVAVDHINGDTFDNRRSNLRLCTQKDNAKNQKQRRNKRWSIYKGVTKMPNLPLRPWIAQIQSDSKRTLIGYYATELEAATAYDEAALRLHGPFARTNKMLGLL